jgi:hypothetical protein
MTNTKPAQCHCGARSWSRDIPAGRYVCVSCYRPLWQPIETAPQDHSIILLAGFDDEGEQVSDIGHWESYVCWHGEHPDPQWSWCYESQPTHWMPLPEPPKYD